MTRGPEPAKSRQQIVPVQCRRPGQTLAKVSRHESGERRDPDRAPRRLGLGEPQDAADKTVLSHQVVVELEEDRPSSR